MAKPEDKGAGRVVDGKYEILMLIGKGGMSNVWLARDRRLGKLWAVKEIKPNVIGAQGAANRKAIIDEANFMKQLDHPAIPRVVDIIDEGSTIFVVMDYIDGQSLSKALRQQGAPFSQEEVIDWGIQLCDVLEYLHDRRPPVVYRDMKPANVMLRDDGSVKVIDFGISEELVPGRGDDGRLIGTPGYAAPEQVVRELHDASPTDTRADIYSLGATLYSLVTGIIPRRVRNTDGSERTGFDVRPIREVDPKLSDGLELIILRAMQRDPDKRYQTIDEMRYDLEHYEDLTAEHRAVQEHKVNTFRKRLIRAGLAAVVGVACLVAAFVVRGSTYSYWLDQAADASTEEVNVQKASDGGATPRQADASEAEEDLARAIEINPSNVKAYEELLDVYKADYVFTTTEAQRWTRIWQAHGDNLANDSHYAGLCYEVGVLYLSYYDYADAADGSKAATGQGAIENATKSLEWFNRAHDAYREEDYDPNDEWTLSSEEYESTEVYQRIASFYTTISQNNREGKDSSPEYENLWQALDDLINENNGTTLLSDAEPIVQLRIYQVAFEVINSPTYLAGLKRAGIAEADVEKMLMTASDRVQGESEFVEGNRDAAGAMYDEVVNGIESAENNIRSVYHNTGESMANPNYDPVGDDDATGGEGR